MAARRSSALNWVRASNWTELLVGAPLGGVEEEGIAGDLKGGGELPEGIEGRLGGAGLVPVELGGGAAGWVGV